MNRTAGDYRSLDVSERIELVEEIWNSIAEDVPATSFRLSPEEGAELHRRLAAHRSDPSSSIPWEIVRDKLFKNQP